jgi:hypothetical protein
MPDALAGVLFIASLIAALALASIAHADGELIIDSAS